MEEQWATDPTEEKTCTVNDLAGNDLRFRYMDLFKVSAEHGQLLWKMVLPYPEECYASHGCNMSPMMRCLTRPTQNPHSLMDSLRGNWLSMVTYTVRNGGITFDLMIGRIHGTRDREEDQEPPGWMYSFHKLPSTIHRDSNSTKR